VARFSLHIQGVRVIGVIDIRSGVAVHARGGRRALYQPVRSPLLPPEQAGDAAGLARCYHDVPGIAEIYVADLDAISGQPMQDLTTIAACALPLMVDSGVSSETGALAVLAHGATRVVIGLETLSSFEDLARIVRGIGAHRVVFSLDLCDAQPLTRPTAPFAGLSPLALAVEAAGTGASTVLLLDLARVGRSVGVDLAFVRTIRAALPAVELLVGGGIRNQDDLTQLAVAGCDGALVGSALHDGVALLHLPHAQ
jgi:phosphoribosylformimino-5-aminoimidazole carboxamide ribotide isomerase